MPRSRWLAVKDTLLEEEMARAAISPYSHSLDAECQLGDEIIAAGLSHEQAEEMYGNLFDSGEFVGTDAEQSDIPDKMVRDLEKLGQESMKPKEERDTSIWTMGSVAEKLLYIDTHPFRFITNYSNPRTGEVQRHDRTYLRDLYDMCEQYPQGSRNQIWHTGRQVEKSTTQSGKSICLGAFYPAYKTLYVAPRFEQVSVFSNQRFKPMAEDSPVMMDNFLRPSQHLWQVGAKEFLNRSFFNFRSCYMTADSSRGISAHHLMIDELQDILSDNIPVLEECQSHYGWETGLRFRSYAGTPKTNNNPLSRRYQQSAQFEWLTECKHCGHWNFPDEGIIGLSHYICHKCGKEIHPQMHGKWEPMRRDRLDYCWGFRLPQMVVPFKTHKDIREKYDDPNISQLKFYNEVLGMPYDEGELVLTEQDMMRACTESTPMQEPPVIKEMYAHRGVPIFAGVDHGTGEGDNPSFTVLSIGNFTGNGKFQVRYIFKFKGKEASLSAQPGRITEICAKAGVLWLGSDWGFGAHQNARLVDDYGWSWVDGERVVLPMMYVKQRQKATFDGKAFKYKIDRNQSMMDCVDAIRRGKIEFAFRYEDLKPFVDDFTTIYIEYNETHGTTKYDHVVPDDTFHSVNYAWMAGLHYYGRLGVRTQTPGLD